MQIQTGNKIMLVDTGTMKAIQDVTGAKDHTPEEILKTLTSTFGDIKRAVRTISGNSKKMEELIRVFDIENKSNK